MVWRLCILSDQHTAGAQCNLCNGQRNDDSVDSMARDQWETLIGDTEDECAL